MKDIWILGLTYLIIILVLLGFIYIIHPEYFRDDCQKTSTQMILINNKKTDVLICEQPIKIIKIYEKS